MSVEMQRAFYAVNLPPTAKFVAVTLAWHHNAETNRCDPSAALLAQETGLCERSVRAALKVIANTKHMTVRQRSGTTPSYLLHPIGPCSKCTPAGDAPHPCRRCTQTGKNRKINSNGTSNNVACGS